MKFSVLQENLKRGIGIVQHAVAAKSTLPVLANILMTTDGDTLILQATNLEISIRHRLDARIEHGGGVTIPAKIMSDFVAQLPNDTVTMTLDDTTQTLTFACAKSQANIKGIEVEEFPTLPQQLTDQDPLFTLPGQLAADALDAVVFAAATDDTRPVLAGVLFTLKKVGDPSFLVLTATDGFRMAVKTITLDTDVTPRQIILPAKSLGDLRRVINTDEPLEIRITESEGQVEFTSGSTSLVTRVIDGKYPDYERIIPAQYQTRSILKRTALLAATKQAAVFAASSANICKVTLDRSTEVVPGRLTLSANAAEVGDNKSEIDGQITGEGGQIALNVKYLKDALDAINGAELVLETQTPATPGVFRPVGDDTYIQIVMPMSVR